ncbi:carboxypeptidase-like regulatory domain-containing protein [Hymenobacter volaticus]|uniref:Carboxypeptidase-like regulatory domain-containing protein n=1 Tax=Hymenobacter volaticus TaxID=2932254 RepID=A0ABY4GC98_9BACT|nr:carboxypeptidase-like regulatory domain-containing protein [Hymenobacter volaticus]UOQ68563.1 carboxypeptidase-like regulatory domain-containing protein [Hymenobacter volaticus]
MPFPLQFPRGPRPLKQVLLTPALSSLVLSSFAAPIATVPASSLHSLRLATEFLSPAVAGGTVSGKVVDQKGEGVPGVTVVVEGTKQGIATNADGSYLIADVPVGPQVLIFSSVGLITARVPVTVTEGQTTQVSATTLAEDVKGLGEVVVVGYGTQSRQELTTSVTSVNAAAIERQPVAGFDQALQGQAPGVQVTAPSGHPALASTCGCGATPR